MTNKSSLFSFVTRHSSFVILTNREESLTGGTKVRVDTAEAYESLQIIAHEKTHQKVLEIFERFSARGKLLEIPAGEGALAWRLHRLGYIVTAGDIDPKFFKVNPIPCIYLDLNRKFPIEDGQFDFISCIEGIEHLQDQF